MQDTYLDHLRIKYREMGYVYSEDGNDHRWESPNGLTRILYNATEIGCTLIKTTKKIEPPEEEAPREL